MEQHGTARQGREGRGGQPQLSDANATLLTHYRGLSVTEIAELRRSLREANAEMRVVKNTLTRRAAADAGIDGLDEMLVGPTALVFCEDDPVAPAKALKAFAKDHPDLVVRGGYFDGEILDEAEAIRLADLESREDLLDAPRGLMHGALANTARLLNAPLEQQARLIQALVDAGARRAPRPMRAGTGTPPRQRSCRAADEDAEHREADDERRHRADWREPRLLRTRAPSRRRGRRGRPRGAADHRRHPKS
jgi:large subunit ribosomal protein L10